MTNPDISLKGADKAYKNLKSVMKHLGQEYSIKVGIIGEQASQTHEGSGLNNATLLPCSELEIILSKLSAFELEYCNKL